jgi:hypothetical protein
MKLWWKDPDRVELEYLRKTCLIATLSTTNPTQTGLGSIQVSVVKRR